ncbi:alpha/beta hydrolase family protein [Hanstruepera ponticola]|uniref:alpha/beta hydrolase family protein n=1 Tax=Hanstruepera ponticola TaxID=2042995 RepID=UPI000CF0153D|nr:prolyl oligopeptidase family serine peptidase [Hanstruepera ponticola]
MYRYLLALLLVLCFNSHSYSQDGKIVNKETFLISDSIVNRISTFDADLAEKLGELNFYKIKYLSDGLKVTAYLVEPKSKGLFPCIVSNRGGNRDFGQWSEISVAYFLGKMATWGYVVIASQYRGNDGGDGMEEFGGKDVNDVLNLVNTLKEIPNADTNRIGIQGGSRGGMMTYLALKESCEFKGAAVTAGAANSFANIESRPEMEKRVYAELIPNYWDKKESELKARSAVYWADAICKTTPLLIMHGSADWRVLPEESMELVEKLYKEKHPTRFILFEGADHGIREFRNDMFYEMKRHFDYYVRDLNALPNMEPHGR